MKKKYWFTLNSGDDIYLRIVVKVIENKYRIKMNNWGSGYYRSLEADFYVVSAKKRNEIKKYINDCHSIYGIKFRSYPVVK